MNNPLPNPLALAWQLVRQLAWQLVQVWRVHLANVQRGCRNWWRRPTWRHHPWTDTPPICLGVSWQDPQWCWAWRPRVLSPGSSAPLGKGLDQEGGEGFQQSSSLPSMVAPRHWSFDDPLVGADMDIWQSAWSAVLREVPPGECHLVLSWPDEALWSSSLTLAGPVLPDEFEELVTQELAAVLPCPLQRAAWDVRLQGASWEDPLHPLGSVQTWMSRLGMGRATRPALQAGGDLSLHCWALPLEWLQQLDALARRLGFASLVLEPRSVSLERAALRWNSSVSALPESVAGTALVAPERMAAFGASYREQAGEPDLWRRHRSWWSGVGRRKTRWASWWGLGLGLAVGVGYMLGAVHADQWAHQREVWQQRMRQLQSAAQEQQVRRQALEQARVQQKLQAERLAYNQQFAQMLHLWAATVPEGLQWQRVSLRPQRIELQGQAGSAEAFSRWIDRWPQTVLARGQHQLQWQPLSEGGVSATTGVASPLTVQLSWQPVVGGRE